MKMLTMSLCAVVLLAPIVVSAEGGAGEDALQRIVREQQTLQAEVEGGRGDRFTARQISAIKKAQGEVFRLVGGKSSIDELTIEEKVRLENALERINAEVKNTRIGREDQDVCKREVKTGSAVKTTRCGTMNEREQTREGARGFLEKRRICIPPGCGT